ncbi:MAG: DUF692 domain-containing protein [Acetobacteraceae bacterium]
MRATPLAPVPIPARAGVGLRFRHHEAFLAARQPVDWIEVHSENYLNPQACAVLEALRPDYGLSLHSVAMSLGSADGIDADHLEAIAALVARLQPALVSEHLAWNAVDHEHLADLLPLPLTEESLAVVARNVARMQERLRRPILIENPATYLQFAHSTIEEAEFLAALVACTGCGLICDVNNIVVSCANHGWNPRDYLRRLPAAAICEFHLAGHRIEHDDAGGAVRIDTHDREIAPETWELFAAALAEIGPRPTLIEWDAAIPPLAVLLAEAARANARLAEHRREHDDACAA